MKIIAPDSLKARKEFFQTKIFFDFFRLCEIQKQIFFTKANFMLQRGFDDLSKLVPALSESAAQGTKESKAGMLNKSKICASSVYDENKMKVYYR